MISLLLKCLQPLYANILGKLCVCFSGQASNDQVHRTPVVSVVRLTKCPSLVQLHHNPWDPRGIRWLRAAWSLLEKGRAGLSLNIVVCFLIQHPP